MVVIFESLVLFSFFRETLLGWHTGPLSGRKEKRCGSFRKALLGWLMSPMFFYIVATSFVYFFSFLIFFVIV